MSSQNVSFKELVEYLSPDCIYVVNLKHRLDRLIRFDMQMRAMNLEYKIIEGVNGRNSFACQQKIQEFIGRKKNDLEMLTIVNDHDYNVIKRRATVAAIGYLESQKLVFEDALKNNYQRILVFDDDAVINEYPLPVDYNFFDYLKDVKIFLPGCSEYAGEKDIIPIDNAGQLYYPVPSKTCGSFAVFYKREMFQPIIDYINQTGITFDNVILGNLFKQHHGACLATRNQFVFADVTESELRKGFDQASFARDRKWDITSWLKYNEPAIISIILTSVEDLVEVTNLEQNLGKNIFLNFYYMSTDGLRPFHPGSVPLTLKDHSLYNIQLDNDFIASINVDNIGEMLEAKQLPFSECAIVWRNGKLDRSGITRLTREIIKSTDMRGETDGNIWVRQCGKKFVPGLHSVIIPTVRPIKNLIPSIESILNQDLDNVEIIIVNDNPVRKLDIEEIHTIFAHHPALSKKYIRVLNHKRNLNASAARNTGLLHSWGEYISFLDDDDLYCEKRLRSVQQSMESSGNPKSGGAYCAYMRGYEAKSAKIEPKRLIPGTLQSYIIKLAYDRHYVHTDTVSFKRQFLNAINGFDEYFHRHQDIELMTRFYAFFGLETAEYMGAILKPARAENTFTPTLQDMLALKQKYLSNFKLLLKQYYQRQIPDIVNCHVKEFYKYFKNMSKTEHDDITQILVKSVLDDQYMN